jgi:hypothetical protein
MKRLRLLFLCTLAALPQGGTASLSVSWSGPQDIPLHYAPNDYQLDVDGNGVLDFDFTGFPDGIWIHFLGDSMLERFAVEQNSIGLGNVIYLAPGTTIGAHTLPANRGWNDEDMPYLLTSSIGGPWRQVEHGLLGFNFDIGGENHYGWMDISYVDNYELTLHSWAWNTEPDSWITAGAVPEPSTWALMLCGVAAMLLRRRRQPLSGSAIIETTQLHSPPARGRWDR